ncbi:MAG: hypothetical protein QG657_3004 [Acidobacteriota bacterium]|nr:hypothetical protein [Acidobacteriota bacterium]
MQGFFYQLPQYIRLRQVIIAARLCVQALSGRTELEDWIFRLPQREGIFFAWRIFFS